MRKKREITFDLTPLLDVILILFFSVLLINTGQVVEYIERFHEAEEYRTVAESERDTAAAELYEARAELHEVSMRLEALSEWDTERLELTHDLGEQTRRMSAIEEAIYIIDMVVQTEDGRRIININARPNIEERIEIIWAPVGNVIQNRIFVSSEIDRVFQSAISPLPNELPIIILLSQNGIARQEFILIEENIRQFIEINVEFIIRWSYN